MENYQSGACKYRLVLIFEFFEIKVTGFSRKKKKYVTYHS